MGWPDLPPLSLATALLTFAKKSIYADNPTAHALLVGNGSGALLTLAPGTARNVAISDGADWASRALVAADIPDLSGTYVTLAAAAAAYQPKDATLTALAAYNTNGLLTQTAADTFTGRSIAAGTGIGVTNGDGVSGNPTIAIDSTVVTLTGSQTLTNKSIAATQLTGTLAAAQFPTLTGDVTTVAGALAATLATVNSNVGSFALATITANAKGLVTAASAASTTGSGNVVLATSPTIVTPTIASLTNAQHTHQNAAGGGTLDAAAIAAGALALARGGTNADLSASGGATLFLAQDGAHVVSARAIAAADLSSLTTKQMLYVPRAGAGIGLSTTIYQSPGSTSLFSTESLSNTKMPFACTLKNLYLRTTGTQPASGSLVITLRVNNGASTLTLTVAAGATAGEFQDTTHSVAIAAGDEIDIQFVNNATATGATMNVLSLETDVPLS